MTHQINIRYYKTAIGEFILGSFDKKLCLLDFSDRVKRAAVDNRLKRGLEAEFIEQNDEVLQNTIRQLDEYFAGERKEFDIPLLMLGTHFQKMVWNEIRQIHYASTATYRQLATSIHHERAVRAVANACGANAIAIIIPCHRIIGSSGKLIGYAGGLSRKKYLLQVEQNNSSSNVST